jgi:drug/metabolite transporter (DMT)-like permease
MNVILTIIIGQALAAAGQIAMKTGLRATGPLEVTPSAIVAMFTNPYILAGLAFYAVGTVFWLSALSRKELSYVYPFVALTYVLVLAGGVVLFGEQITMQGLVGTGLVLLGLSILML